MEATKEYIKKSIHVQPHKYISLQGYLPVSISVTSFCQKVLFLQQSDNLFLVCRDKSEITTNTLMSDDMRREIQREEWERQELETMEAEKSGPIHYSDVRHSGTD